MADAAKLVSDSLRGVIDCHGDIVVPCKFDDEVAFDKNGVAKVKKDGEGYFINTKGERVEIN